MPQTPAPAGAAGLVLLSLLVLTGCGGAADSAAEESAPAASHRPAAADQPEAPAYAEIESDLWEAMQQADSVALTGEMPATFLHPDGDGEARLTYAFSGAVDGSNSTHRTTRDGHVSSDARLIGEAYYEPAGVALDTFARNVDSWDVPQSARRKAEGRWVEWTGLYDVESRTTATFLEDLRAVLEGRDPLVTLDGGTKARDGQDVWVYSDGIFEAVVRPGEAPVLLSVAGEARDGPFEVQFCAWNSSKGPGAPPEQKTMSRAELGKLVGG